MTQLRANEKFTEYKEEEEEQVKTLMHRQYIQKRLTKEHNSH